MYNKIFTKILDSSIWLETNPTRIVWFTLLAAMDETGFAQFASPANLAYRARVTQKEAEAAIKCLEGPDPNSSDPENAGRRVERVYGGWVILNAAKYREIVTRAVAQEKTRLRVHKFRTDKAHGAKAEEPVTPCNAHVTLGNAHVTPCNKMKRSVTPSEADTDTDTEAEAEIQKEVFPETLKTDAFRAKWAEYVAYRRQANFRTLKPASIAKLAKQLAEWGHESAIKSIDQTIRNGWQGLFEPAHNSANGINPHQRTAPTAADHLRDSFK